jgi:hypothetical protein
MSEEILNSREAVEKAWAELSTDEPETEVVEAPSDDTPSEDSGRERDEFGRFKSRETPDTDPEPVAVPEPIDAAAPVEPAPSGFQPSAAADWAKTPESVRADVQRRFSEMEKGITEYRQRFEPLKRYDEMARAGGTSLDVALANYTNIEQTLARNPVEGIDLILRNIGSDVRSFAAHIMGQPAPEANAQVQQMRSQMQAMHQELIGYRNQREQSVSQQVQDFATEHPRFEELSEDIRWLLDTKGAKTLEQAYRKAELLNPIPAAAAHTSAAATSTPEPRKPAGSLSIRGAPSSGSNPARASESLSTRDSVARAAATLGISV